MLLGHYQLAYLQNILRRGPNIVDSHHHLQSAYWGVGV